jgi:hypothetical protein
MSAIAKENLMKKREEWRAASAHYDKWADFKWRWWNKADIPKVPDFSGKQGSNFKWPVVHPSGKWSEQGSQIYQDMADRLKIVNNTWRNCFFMQWHVLQEELGKEKADEMIGYMWLGMVAAMEGLNERYLEGQARDCMMLSRQWQIDCLYEMHDFNVLKQTPNHVVIDTLCTYWADWKGRWAAKGIDIHYGLCELGCLAWCKEWANKMNPHMTCERTMWLVEGDPVCRYEFTIPPGKENYKMGDPE